MATSEVTRKIYFFRLIVAPNEDGSTPDFSIADALGSIKQLKFSKDAGPRSRYFNAGENNIVCAWPTVSEKRICVRLGRIRRTDLPGVENSGEVNDLPIGPGDGILDTTHVEFFADNIVGAEFNFYGPRATSIANYCREKLPWAPAFRLHPLLHKDAAQQLDDLADIRLLSVRVIPSRAETTAQIEESIPASFEAIRRQYGAGALDIVIRAKPRKTLRRTLIGAAKNMIQSSANPLHDFQSFHVKGRSESLAKVVEYDLLRDKLIASRVVTKLPGRSRSIRPESMYGAIEAAYNEQRSELLRASALGIEVEQ